MSDEIIATVLEQPPIEPPATTGESPQPPHIDEPPDPTKLQADIEELQRKREKAETDAKYWRDQKARERAEFFRERGQQPPATQQPPMSTEPQEPKLANFEDYDKYVEAVADFRADRKIKAWERERANREVIQSTQEKEAVFYQKLDEGNNRYEDFERVVYDPSATHITAMVKSILMELDSPADVAYYLARNRAEGIVISRMTPYKAAQAIGKIEAEVSKTLPNNNKKPVTAAPPPITPLGSRETSDKDPEKLTGKEYEQWLRGRGVKMF